MDPGPPFGRQREGGKPTFRGILSLGNANSTKWPGIAVTTKLGIAVIFEPQIGETAAMIFGRHISQHGRRT